MQDAIEALRRKLAERGLRYTESRDTITWEPPSAQGFTVSIQFRPPEFVVFYEGWHEHFLQESEALDCFAFGLSSDSRLRVESRGKTPVRWTLEYREGDSWRAESAVGRVFTPFWRRKSATYLQNNVWKASLLLCFSLLFGCLKSVPRETVIAPAVAKLGIEFLRGPFSPAGIPILSQKHAGGGVSLFLLDTGSEGTSISDTYAARMDFPSRCTVPYTVVGAENETRRALKTVRIGELRLDGSGQSGSAAFREFDALVVHSPIFDRGIAGILGAPLFRNCTFTIDFAAKMLLIEDGAIGRDLPHTTPIRITSGGVIHLPIEIAGKAEWALLDTGDTGFLSVPEEKWAELPLKDFILEGQMSGFSFGGPSRSRFGQLDGYVVIAGQSIRDPFVTSNPKGAFRIGGGLLSGFALSIDQRNRLARLSPGAPGGI